MAENDGELAPLTKKAGVHAFLYTFLLFTEYRMVYTIYYHRA